MDEAERRNREEITQEDKAKNLEWMVVGTKGERRLIKSARGEDGEGRRGRASASSHTVTGRETDSEKDGKREDTGARRKKQYNKRNRSTNSDSEMEQEQPHRRTRK
jgi:hypothetical protein